MIRSIITTLGKLRFYKCSRNSNLDLYFRNSNALLILLTLGANDLWCCYYICQFSSKAYDIVLFDNLECQTWIALCFSNILLFCWSDMAVMKQEQRISHKLVSCPTQLCIAFDLRVLFSWRNLFCFLAVHKLIVSLKKYIFQLGVRFDEKINRALRDEVKQPLEHGPTFDLLVILLQILG